MINKTFFFIFLFFLSLTCYSQDNLEINSVDIEWENSKVFEDGNNKVYVPICKTCNIYKELPYFSQELSLTSNHSIIKVTITDFQTSNLTSQEAKYVTGRTNEIGDSPKFEINTSFYKNKETNTLEGFPLVKVNGVVKKVTHFTYKIKRSPMALSSKGFAAHSVLNNPSDRWYKIAVNTDGIYKIDKSFLASIGVDVNNLNPHNINIYGNANGRLPILNSIPRPDDLVKNSIYISGESDNSFDDGDYILFQGYGPSKWSYVGGKYQKDMNPYSKDAFYYIRISSSEPPLRIASTTPSGTASATITKYDYSLVHEVDMRNLVQGGQRFYGEEFDSQLSQTFNFAIPDYISDVSTIRFSYGTLNPYSGSTLKLYLNNTLKQTFDLAQSTAGTNETVYGRSEETVSFTPNSNSLAVRLDVNRANPSVITYLDKIEVFAKRQLKMPNGTMYFRTSENVGPGKVNEYVITNFSTNTQVWDVTNRTNPIQINGNLAGNVFTFVSPSDVVHEFVAFTTSDFLTPVFSGEVASQDLHGLPFANILIVSNPIFMSYANQMADLHRNLGETVNVVSTEQVYNEFSSGQKDPMAIRFFAKMFYDRAAGDSTKAPQNLILFGNGTYDPRGIVISGDYVPTYEDPSGEAPISAFVSDDFFGMLDNSESFSNSNLMDIGVGRIAVANGDEANIVVNKTRTYIENNYNNNSTFADWRLRYMLIADDENYFLNTNCEPIYNYVTANFPIMNVNKVYADAYPQQITLGGIRLPGMEADIDEGINQGSLVVGYIGHGGIKGAGQERFIDRDRIQSWSNIEKLHLFVSATCDFARIDDPSEISAGETSLLNPNGGAVALMTTNRSIYYTVNTDISKHFFDTVFKKDILGRGLTFGEIFKLTKNSSPASDNKRSFMVVGDPALRLALPQIQVMTDSINGKSITAINLDTLKALSKITIKGHIADNNNSLVSSFNGILTPSVFDKPKLNKTLGHLPGVADPIDYYTQNNILYKGNITVTNGRFEFTFIVPKDIDYTFGKGKISYYATNKVIDAGGFSNNIMVGGVDPNGVQDKIPPVIEAYMNDKNFVNGGLTDENPKFIAKLSDNYGINAVGNGIGHDIAIVLDGDETKPIILNDYYLADLDSYQSGSINYQFKNLAIGPHTLKLKVWDVNNNSAEFKLNFLVAKKQELAISHVLNYPNPFTTSTDFFFEHNQFNEMLETQIQIYTVSGKLVKTINSLVNTSGFRSEGIHWDGRDDFGDKLARGVYVYILSVKDSSGKKVQKLEKLVLL